MRNILFGTAAAAVALSGCTTTLSTTRNRNTAGPSQAVTGFPYSLPAARFDIKVTRTLERCFAVAADGSLTSTPDVAFSIEVEATPRMIAGEQFQIDYRALSDWTKVSGIVIESHPVSGTLRTFNASVEDRTAQIIGSGVRSIVGVARIASGLPTSPLALDSGSQAAAFGLKCTDAAQAKLDDIKARTDRIDDATTALKALTAEIVSLSERADTGELSEADMTMLTTKLNAQAEQSAALGRAQAALVRAKAAVTSVSILPWTPTRESLVVEVPFQEDETGILNGLVTRVALLSPTGDTPVCTGTTTSDCLAGRLSVTAQLEPAVDAGNDERVRTAIDSSLPSAGIFIRPPGQGRVIACQSVWPQDCHAPQALPLGTGADIVVPQLGQLHFLPFRNGAFQNNMLSVVLRADGSAERLEYRDKAARGEAAAATLADLVTQAGGFATDLRADRQADRDARAATTATARAETLAQQRFAIDQLTLENEYEALRNPPADSELTSTRAQIELAQARAALAEAELAEREARAALAAQP